MANVLARSEPLVAMTGPILISYCTQGVGEKSWAFSIESRKLLGCRMVYIIALSITDHEVPGRNPAREGIQLFTGGPFIAQSLSLSSFCFLNTGIKHGFSCINIRQVPWEVLKTKVKGRSFQHLPRTWRMLMHWKTMFDHYYCIKTENICYISRYFLHYFVCFAISLMSRECYFHELCSF